MTLITVALRNVSRNGLRNGLTVAGVAVAIVAFVLLRTVLSAWTMGAEFAAQDRVATRHKITFIMSLPKRYVQQVEQIDGVTAVTWMTWFGARIEGKEDKFFANIATDPASFLEVYDELELPADQKQKWLENRQGAIVGSVLARQFGWRLGDRVVLSGTIYPGDWEVIIEGIYTASRRSIDQSSMYFHWKYLNESIQERDREQVGWIVSKVTSASVTAAVSRRIDQIFDVQDVQTLSMSERALNASFLGMLSTMLQALEVISLVILLIMMLIMGNTIAMGVRERTREYGVLRAIGFLPRHIVTFILAEAAAIGALGGLIGVGLAVMLIDYGVGATIEENFTSWFPYFRTMPRDMLMALLAAVLLAVVAAGLPAMRAAQLNVTTALRRVA